MSQSVCKGNRLAELWNEHAIPAGSIMTYILSPMKKNSTSGCWNHHRGSPCGIPCPQRRSPMWQRWWHRGFGRPRASPGAPLLYSSPSILMVNSFLCCCADLGGGSRGSGGRGRVRGEGHRRSRGAGTGAAARAAGSLLTRIGTLQICEYQAIDVRALELWSWATNTLQTQTTLRIYPSLLTDPTAICLRRWSASADQVIVLKQNKACLF